jgi:hypothetical protein
MRNEAESCECTTAVVWDRGLKAYRDIEVFCDVCKEDERIDAWEALSESIMRESLCMATEIDEIPWEYLPELDNEEN